MDPEDVPIATREKAELNAIRVARSSDGRMGGGGGCVRGEMGEEGGSGVPWMQIPSHV